MPTRASNDDNPGFRAACDHRSEREHCLNPVEIAKDRLLSLESAIERRYLKPPLGIRYIQFTIILKQLNYFSVFI